MLIDFELFLKEFYPEPLVDRITVFYKSIENTPLKDTFDMQWLEQVYSTETKDLDTIINDFNHLVTTTVNQLYLDEGISINLPTIWRTLDYFTLYEQLKRLEVDDKVRSILESEYNDEEQLAELFSHLSGNEPEEYMVDIREVSSVWSINTLVSESTVEEDEPNYERLRRVPEVRDRILKLLKIDDTKTKFVERVNDGMSLALPFNNYVTLFGDDWFEDVNDGTHDVGYEVFMTALGSSLELKDIVPNVTRVMDELTDDASVVIATKVRSDNLIKMIQGEHDG